MARFEIIDGRCVIPHGVTEILEEEFADCQELKEVVIPDTVVNIGMGAFMECHSLQSVTIPRSVTKIPHCAFFWCTSLKEVFIPDSVKVIGPQAFEGCAKLRSVTIPEGVEDLNSTFYQCASLKEISIPSSVIEIGHNTFSACTRLERIDVAEDNPSATLMAERGLYPLLAIMAATAFCHGLYNPDTFTVASSLMTALAQFLSLFLTQLIARSVLESALPPLEADRIAYLRNELVPVFCTGLLALINIVANLCPIELAIFWFLPVLLIIVFWHTTDYLFIKTDKTGAFMGLLTVLLVIVPVLLNFILSLVL